MSPTRPSLSIQLPPVHEFPYSPTTMPKTPEAQQHEAELAVDPPPPPRPQTFKVKRKRPSAPFQEPAMLDTSIIPTIEMSEVETQMSSPTLQPTSAHLLLPLPLSSVRAFTPPKTPAPRLCTPFSQLDAAADEWDLIANAKPTYQRANSVCSSFSDSSISSCGSSAFSMPTGGYDSPSSETTDPFMDDDLTKQQDKSNVSPTIPADAPQTKRIKTRRHVQWTPQMDDHLWMTFMAYLSDPTLTPFKMLPGSTPPMGVCDQVATKARRTWKSRKVLPANAGSIDAALSLDSRQREGSPDTIRPSSFQSTQCRWPKAAATRRRLRELCSKRPSISAHYARMLRTRSPSPFDTSSPPAQPVQPVSLSSSFFDMHKSLMTSTAPSMQPGGVLAQLASDEPPPAPRQVRQPRPEGWFDRIPRSKAHQKSASLQSELQIHVQDMESRTSNVLASPFAADSATSRSQLLHSMATTRSLGRTEFNGRSLDSPFDFKVGAPTDRRSRKRRFRSDEEKPRRGALEDVFGPPVEQRPILRNRGFSVGTALSGEHLTNLFTPSSSNGVDHVMLDAAGPGDDAPMGSRSAPRRMIEPVPRLLSPFVETPPPSRQSNTFPRVNLLPTITNQAPFHQQLLQLQHEHASNMAKRS
ncbi:hypothetical protein CB0940_10544 [Cercospora beticola]|uniref:Uncharacterized protein n=2 Tax=Cercospora beticola TaxID=122368 RepID=A0A2G5HUQ0_CERBT|nr:hypothetical protein CB0940_10544 [Cercospora beticola]PIA96277.1 hypothetical protein CB0940_10544 [Cercospora beticola]